MGAGAVASAPNVRQGGRLIYAEPRDLPSFPSLGLRRGKDAASRAASLGWANQKGPAQPGDNAAASTAVALARNAPSVKTAQTPAAAVDEIAQRLPAALGGASAAASQAFKAHQARKSSQTTVAPATVTSTPASLDRQKSLRAAKLAGVRTGAGARPRSQSNPLSPRPSDPDEANAAALSAATLAHRPSVRHIANFGGAVPYTTMDRQMFTSHPPVQAEVDEQRRSLVIHASALAMAKRLYSQQQRVTDATKHASPEANAPRPATADSASHSGSQTAPYGSLQEAAYGLAQERLAKLHEEHRQTRGFQEYYGNPGAPQRRSAIRARLRRRASSDGAVVEDRKRSQQIRDQMSLFSTRLSRVDEQKQRRDREAVLDAAQRNVQAQLKDMDTRVYAVTGRVPPTVLDEWEQKAHAAAHARSEARKDGNAGRVDVGGGLYVDRKTVDEAAAKRVQPIIKDIHDKAEKERERLTALKMDEEARQREAEREKIRDKEIRRIHAKIKSEQKEKDRLRKEELKHEEKAAREEVKAARAQQKREGKGVNVPDAAPTPGMGEMATAPTPANPEPATAKEHAGRYVHRPNKLQIQGKAPVSCPPVDKSPTSEGVSPSSKVKSWLRSRLIRPRSKTEPGRQPDFVGGQRLTRVDGTGGRGSLDRGGASSREGSPAGRAAPLATTGQPQKQLARATGSTSDDVPSPVSSMANSSDEDFFEAGDGRSGRRLLSSITPPNPMRDPVTKKSASPLRDSRFLENL